MSYPYLSDETFDDGSRGSFDGETDAQGILDFPHYAELARGGFAPWLGAHALRVRLSGTSTGLITETGALDTAGGGTVHVWFPVLIGGDIKLAASGAVAIFALRAGATDEVAFGVQNTAGVYELYVTDGVTTRTMAITPSNKRWYEIELSCLIDSGVGDDGTITCYIDGGLITGGAITDADQGAITDAVLGATSGTSALDRGTILVGGFMADDLRIYPRRRKRFICDRWITKDVTAFIGTGELDACSITTTDTNGVLNIYDTDIYEPTGVNFSRIPLIYTRNVTANDQSPGMTTPVRFEKGCYVQLLAGAAPQAFVSLRDTCPSGVIMSDANYVDRGLKRNERV